MITALACLASLLAVVGVLWFARKAGKDAANAEAREQIIEDIVDANRPADPIDLARVRGRLKRD